MATGKRVALVTGAAGNLGRAVCERLARDGLEVVRVERERAFVGTREIGSVDLGSVDATAGLVSRVLDACGSLDVAVHTVGSFRASGPAHASELEAYSFLFETNVLTTVRLLRAVLGPMRAQGHGRVVVVSSTAANRASAELAAYGASKAAQLRVVESAAAELMGSDIAVSTVLPGTMDTPQNRAAMPAVDHATWVTLAEVAEVIAFLCSPAAAPLSGRAITVARG